MSLRREGREHSSFPGGKILLLSLKKKQSAFSRGEWHHGALELTGLPELMDGTGGGSKAGQQSRNQQAQRESVPRSPRQAVTPCAGAGPTTAPLSVGLESRHSWGTWGAILRCPRAHPNCTRRQEGPFFVSAQALIVRMLPLPLPCASALPRDGSGRKGRTCNICIARAAGASRLL